MKLPGVTRRHLALLRAALEPGEAARSAWTAWLQGADVERLDYGSTRLLPLAVPNVTASGVPESEIPQKLRGVCRHAWSRNQLLLRVAGDAATILRERGVEFRIIHGAAMVLDGYPGGRGRSLRDVDIMVRPGGRAPAGAALCARGWRRAGPEFDEAWRLTPDGVSHLNVREHALLERIGSDRADWDRPGRATWGGVEVELPDPETRFLHLCVGGLHPVLPPPLVWAADAVMLLRRHGPAMNWERILAAARAARLTRYLEAAVGFLREPLGQPVPAMNLQSADSRAEWLIRAWGERFLGPLPRWWFHTRRVRTGYLPFVARALGLSRARDLPAELLRRGWKRMRPVRGTT
jgi:hypothetical protein